MDLGICGFLESDLIGGSIGLCLKLVAPTALVLEVTKGQGGQSLTRAALWSLDRKIRSL
jgi:hypothetical protein